MRKHLTIRPNSHVGEQICDLANSLAEFGELNGNLRDSKAQQEWKLPNNLPIFAKQFAKKTAK
jgi:hypothetical protein